MTLFCHYQSLFSPDFWQFPSFITRSMTSPRQTLSKAVNEALIITGVVEQKTLQAFVIKEQICTLEKQICRAR